MAITGAAEKAWIMDASTGIGGFAGGRVYKTAVPDETKLPREGGKVRPYIVVTFQSPFASGSGRSVAGGEKAQPHIMTAMVTSYAGDPDSAEALDNAVKEKLVGAQPSASAGVIQLVGGYSYDVADQDSRPSRFASASWLRFHINL